MAKLIDGKAIAAAVRREVQDAVAARAARGAPPSLVSVQVGDDPASDLYVRRQEKSCAKLGIAYRRLRLPNDTSENALLEELGGLNTKHDVTGIILQMPLPPHIDPRQAQRSLNASKDVEGVHPENLGWLLSGRTTRVPPTAAATLACIESTGVPLEGAEAVVVGHSETVGKPVALLLMERRATVTMAHHATHDVARHTAKADIVVVAVGKPGLVTAAMIKPGAVVVDVGINEVAQEDGSTTVVGDVDPSVADQAGWLSPVPGGVGPVTVAMLMRNAAK